MANSIHDVRKHTTQTADPGMKKEKAWPATIIANELRIGCELVAKQSAQYRESAANLSAHPYEFVANRLYTFANPSRIILCKPVANPSRIHCEPIRESVARMIVHALLTLTNPP